MITFLKNFIILIALTFQYMPTSLKAATIINLDPDPQILTVQGGREARHEIIIEKGKKTEFCLRGCFVTFPGGDCHALIGNETIEILGGKVKIR